MTLPELPSHLMEKAKLELNEHPDTRMEKIQELRHRVKELTDIVADTTDQNLIRFLRARKFDMERSLDLVRAHYQCKSDFPELFTNFNPSTEKKTFESGFNIGFPDRDQNGCQIFAVRPGFWDPSQQTMLNNLRANLLAFEIMAQNDETQINGVVLILDFREFGLTQAKAMNPLLFRKYGSIIFNSYPLRLKGIHVIKQPAIFSVIYSIISHFMKEKLKKRVRLHGESMEGLFDYIDKEVLPSDYGGLKDQTDVRIWLKTVINAEEEFEHLWT